MILTMRASDRTSSGCFLRCFRKSLTPLHFSWSNSFFTSEKSSSHRDTGAYVNMLSASFTGWMTDSPDGVCDCPCGLVARFPVSCSARRSSREAEGARFVVVVFIALMSIWLCVFPPPLLRKLICYSSCLKAISEQDGVYYGQVIAPIHLSIRPLAELYEDY